MACHRFRRRHTIADYLVDFVCLPAWLEVEVDGPIHTAPEAVEYDGGRTHALQECGFPVIRFTNELVLNSLPLVLAESARHVKLLAS